MVDWTHCPHHDVLALLKRDGGRIVEWNLVGPIKQHEAVRRLREVAAIRAREFADMPDPISRIDTDPLRDLG
jgi:hypothetical protein